MLTSTEWYGHILSCTECRFVWKHHLFAKMTEFPYCGCSALVTCLTWAVWVICNIYCLLMQWSCFPCLRMRNCHSSPHSLVPGWSQESHLSHRQQGTVLRTGWDTAGVSPIWKDTETEMWSDTLQSAIRCISASWQNHIFFFLPDRKKPLLFYFNILKCASPLVLLELQCPTTQVRNKTCTFNILFNWFSPL